MAAAQPMNAATYDLILQQMLSEQERKLPDEQRMLMIKQRLLERQTKKAVRAAAAAAAAENGSGDNALGNGNAQRARAPSQPVQQQQQQRQQPQQQQQQQQQPLQPPPSLLEQQQMQLQQQQHIQMQQQQHQNGTPAQQHAALQQHQSPVNGMQGMGMPGSQGGQMDNSQQMFQQQQMYQQGQMQSNSAQQQQSVNNQAIENNARLRQQAMAQQQNMTPHIQQQQLPNQNQPGQNQLHANSARPPNFASSSPQQQQQMGSPHVSQQGQAHGRSPSQGPGGHGRTVPTPQQMNVQLPNMNQQQGQQRVMQGQQQGQQSHAKTLTDNFNLMWDKKRNGTLSAADEKLFDQLLQTPEGRAQLEQIQAQNASALVNQLGQIQTGQQHAPMTHAQMALAAQQQLAPLQQQQALMQMQSANGQALQFANNGNGNGIPNGQTPQQVQAQNLAYAQRFAMSQAAAGNQRALAQQNLASLAASQSQHQQQALALARTQSAQQQIKVAQMALQAQHTQHAQHAQIQAIRDSQMQNGDPNAYSGSPRLSQGNIQMGGQQPIQGQNVHQQQQQFQQPQQVQQQQQQGSAPQQSGVNPSVLVRLAQMPEAERENFFVRKPGMRSVFTSFLSNPQGFVAMHHANNQNNQANTMATAPSGGVGTPNGNHINNNGNNQIPTQSNGQYANSPQSRVSANLHIPASKQRNLLPTQSAGTPPPNGSPIHIPQNFSTPAQAALRQMINSGIPVQNNGNGVVGNGGNMNGNGNVDLRLPGRQGSQSTNPPFNYTLNNIHSQMNPKDIKPEMLISQIDPKLPRGRATSMNGRRDSSMPPGSMHNNGGYHYDKSESILSQAKWVPDEAYDSALKEKLRRAHSPVRSSASGSGGNNGGNGRSTLFQGLAQGRVLSGVPLEKVPEAIQAIAEEDEAESLVKKKKEVDPALPSRKKRKVQEVAESVDKGLIIDGEVEMVMLQVADEHLDVISQVSCNLAKHRRSDTIDRKDVQLAYESILGRTFPGFSSDQIRTDQSKPAKRPPMNAMRVNKLRLVADAKATWRREQVETRQKASEGNMGGSGDMISVSTAA